MDKIKSLKVKQADGTFSTAIPFGADAVNVTMADGSTLEDKVSTISQEISNESQKMILWNWNSTTTVGDDTDNQLALQIVDIVKNNIIPMIHLNVSDISGKSYRGVYYYAGHSLSEATTGTISFRSSEEVAMTDNSIKGRTITTSRARLQISVVDGEILQTVLGLNEEDTSSFLSTTVSESLSNIMSYTPTLDMHPATKKYVDDLVSTMGSLKMEVVATLPTENISTSTIYLLPIGTATTGTSSGEETTTAPNAYEEYLYINNVWELIGTTQVDLSGYVTTETFNTEIGSLGNQVGRAQSAADEALSQLENLEVEETEVAISATEPADEAKIWINPNEDATLTTLSEVAFTGDYNDLINIPSIDTSGEITESQVTEMINSATSNFITSGEVDTKISTATADLVTTSAISKMVTSNSVRRVEAVTEYPSNPEDGVLYIQIAS